VDRASLSAKDFIILFEENQINSSISCFHPAKIKYNILKILVAD